MDGMLKDELGKRAKAVNEFMQGLVGEKPAELYGPMRYLLDSGGKRTWLSGKMSENA